MSSTFYKTFLDNDNAFIRGPARLVYAPYEQDFPTSISDVITLVSTDSLDIFDAQDGWSELGATKGGTQINTVYGGETAAVDPITGQQRFDPTSWSASISTATSEMMLGRIRLAWETSSPAMNDDGEFYISFGNTMRFTQRRLAILYNDEGTGKIRAIIFRKVQLDFQESGMNFQKTGDQQTLPIKFRGLPDPKVLVPQQKIFTIFDGQEIA